MNNLKLVGLGIGIIAIVILAARASSKLEYVSFADFRRAVAGVFFVESITEGELKEAYANAQRGDGKVKVLIVPGHDDTSWGTEFNGIREADLTMRIGEALAEKFAENPAYEAVFLRDRKGYLPPFEAYLAENKERVRAEVTRKKKIMSDLLAAGSVERSTDGVQHNRAALDVVLRLYAVNQWANENGFHLVLHLHLNDHGGRPRGKVGKYEGFALYIPEAQYSNARASRAVGEALFAEFSSVLQKSNLPREDTGVVPDQSLIAVGAYNTLDAAAVLIEYGYIYESSLRTFAGRQEAIARYAALTFRGIERFFR